MMTTGEIVRLILGSLLLLGGLFALVTAVVGNFRFGDVLQRMHAAGVGDTMGVFLIFAGVTVLTGFSDMTPKLLAVLVLLWIAGPTVSHLIAEMVLRDTEPEIEDRTGKAEQKPLRGKKKQRARRAAREQNGNAAAGKKK